MSLSDLEDALQRMSLPELLELMRNIAEQIELQAMELIGRSENEG